MGNNGRLLRSVITLIMGVTLTSDYVTAIDLHADDMNDVVNIMKANIFERTLSAKKPALDKVMLKNVHARDILQELDITGNSFRNDRKSKEGTDDFQFHESQRKTKALNMKMIPDGVNNFLESQLDSIMNKNSIKSTFSKTVNVQKENDENSAPNVNVDYNFNDENSAPNVNVDYDFNDENSAPNVNVDYDFNDENSAPNVNVDYDFNDENSAPNVNVNYAFSENAINAGSVSLFHVRRRRSTNDTAASGFFDSADNIAMYIVLPSIVFVYGGCVFIYCMNKCHSYVERNQPVRKVRRKILRTFGRPVSPDPEEDEPEVTVHRTGNRPRLFMLSNCRPSSVKSMPDSCRRNNKEIEDLRSAASTPGLSYQTHSETGSTKEFTGSDVDSGVHSEGLSQSRADVNRIILIDTEQRDIASYGNLNVQVKKVSTTEIAVQTDDVTIIGTKDRSFKNYPEENEEESNKPKIRKNRKFNHVGSRYLGWLKSSREIQEVLDGNEQPQSMPEHLTGIPDKQTETFSNVGATYVNINRKRAQLQKTISKNSQISVSPTEQTTDNSTAPSSRSVSSIHGAHTEYSSTPPIETPVFDRKGISVENVEPRAIVDGKYGRTYKEIHKFKGLLRKKYSQDKTNRIIVESADTDSVSRM